MRLTKTQFLDLLCRAVDAGFISADILDSHLAGTLEIDGYKKCDNENAFNFFSRNFVAVEESDNEKACRQCWFRENGCGRLHRPTEIPYCTAEKRADKREVYFKLV